MTRLRRGHEPHAEALVLRCPQSRGSNCDPCIATRYSFNILAFTAGFRLSADHLKTVEIANVGALVTVLVHADYAVHLQANIGGVFVGDVYVCTVTHFASP